MNGFFEELKRRKVYRVAVAYVIGAAGMIQLASAVFPAWDLPAWALRFTVVLSLIGFPLALLLAWAFDVTAQGIRSTPSLALPHESEAANRHRRRNVTLLIGSGVLVSAVAGFFLLPRAAATKMEKSVAVLPFENYSNIPENAYFADGIQDDILTNLSKLSDLKVISRTSVMAYRGKQQNVRQIGKELGVSAILEGTVRREGDRVRVNVQLINAETDQHLWAEEYDRELTDVFVIQTDLAQKIAHELQAKLSPSEKAGMVRKPTENGEAYLAFVEAHNLQASLDDREKLDQARQLYERAIQLDPKFVLAIANLSILHSWMYHQFEPTDAEGALAKKYADQARALAPDSPEAHLANGYLLYYPERDYEGALREFGLAQASLPNDSQVYLLIGAIERRQGKWQESTANLEKAVRLDPNNTWPLQNLFFNYTMLRQFEAAERLIDRALTIQPKSFELWSLKAKLAVTARGDLTVAEKGLAEVDQELTRGKLKDLNAATLVEIALANASVALLRGRPEETIEVLRQLPLETLAAKPQGIEAFLLEGIAYEKLGQAPEARAVFLKAKETATAAVQSAPNDASRHAALSRALAHLGEKEAAIAEADRAVELRPVTLDAFEGPRILQARAEVYALTSENAKAIEALRELLSRPSDVTVPWLKVDPAWDRLRTDPAFQNLLSEH